MAVCNRNAEPEWPTDSVVEWNVLGAVSDGRWWRPVEFEWELVSERESFDAMLDSTASRKPDAAEREWAESYGVGEREVSSDDQLAGNHDQRNGIAGRDADQLGQRDVLDSVPAVYAVKRNAIPEGYAGKEGRAVNLL